MSTQPETECDAAVFKGPVVLMLAGLASTAIEAQVVRWREESGRPIDWHFAGGRALIRTTPEHEKYWRLRLGDWEVQVMR